MNEPIRSVAVLGLGAMGARMAARLGAAGFEVRVWSRTPRPDAVPGATTCPTAAAAVTGAQAALSMVRDDEAARAVWLGEGGALAALPGGALALDCSTVTPGWARALHAAAAARGLECLDAPVLGSRPQAEAGQLIFLLGGSPEACARAVPLTAAMGAAAHRCGGAGAGATLKLAANGLFALQVAALAEVLAWLDGAGLPPAAATDLLGGTPVLGLAAKGAAAAIAAGRHAPLFPIDLVAKDLAYASAEAARAGVACPLLDVVHARFEAARAAGLGGLNVTGVARLALAAPAPTGEGGAP